MYASEDRNEAEEWANNKAFNDARETLDEWDIDDPSDKNMTDAFIQAQYDNGCYEVEKVNITNLTEDDNIKLENGSEIDVDDILKAMED